MPLEPRHSVSVAGIVTNEQGEVLVVKRRDNGEWQPPGGVLELDETIEDGLKREIREETGIRVDVGPLTGVYKNLRLAVVALVFKCTLTGGDLRPSDESEDSRWISPDDAQRIMTPTFALRVRDALNPQIGATHRSHDGSGAC